VKIGKNGLGLGLGEKKLLMQNIQTPIKHEGDKKAPIGIFKLSSVFGYAHKINTDMPYIYASKNLICIDDSNSKFYNKIVYKQGDVKSFEYMKRDDLQYELGIVVQHNKQAINKRGSCIFIHVQKTKNSPTAGCTAMSLENLKKIVFWLNIKKNPILIQIPKSAAKEILKLYPQLKNSKLLN
jgi:L,D-peptidoglycan transpeptidase YkuD (ErfK/YbiS/YcfS/YnhG family)